MKHGSQYETLVDRSDNSAFTKYKVESGGNPATKWIDWSYTAAYVL